MLRTYLHESFTNDFTLARIKLKNVLEYLQHEISGLTEDDLFDLRVVYSELIANAITHGNKSDITKKVDLFIEMDGKAIISVIRDEGTGFDYSKVPVKSREVPRDIFSENGRGLQLVASLVDFFEWNTTGNEIKFYKKYSYK